MLYYVVKYLILVIAKIIFRVEVNGIVHIPKKGPCILCFSHRSLLDPPVLGVFMPRQLAFMAKEELFRIPVLGFLIRKLGSFPVKRGTGDLGAIKTAIRILNKGNALAMFPEGTRVKAGEDKKAKPGVALIATKAKVPVIPIGANGKYKLFRKLKINIGEPVILEEYYNQKLPMEKLQEISNHILKKIKMLMEVE